MRILNQFCIIYLLFVLNSCFSLDLKTPTDLSGHKSFAPYIGKKMELKRDAYLNISTPSVNGEFIKSVNESGLELFCGLSVSPQQAAYPVKKGTLFKIERIMYVNTKMDYIYFTLTTTNSTILGCPIDISYIWVKNCEPLFALENVRDEMVPRAADEL